MIEITSANFDAEVLKSDKPVIIDFWASWCGPCVPPETVILGDNKPILEMVPNNYAFGLTGHNKVTETFKRPYNGRMFQIKANGLLKIYATPEHPILVATSQKKYVHEAVTSFSELKWKEPKELIPKRKNSNGDYLVLPRIKGENNIRKISLLPYIKERNIKIAKAKKVPLDFPLNDQTAWLLGLYTAEGNTSDNAVVFNLGYEEKNLQQNILSIGRELGYSPCISRSSQSAVKVSIKSRLLTRAFPVWCGKLAPNKKIPDFIILHKHNKIVKAFIQGYLAGDGSKFKNLQTARTCSKTLALQLQLLYARLGVFASVQLSALGGISKILGRTVHTHDMYTITVHLSGQSHSKVQDRYIFVPIRKIKTAPYSGNVYNLETTDNTYLVNNAVVHNCRIFSPVIEEVEKDYKGKVKFGKLNTDDNTDIAQQYNIMSIPTVLLFEKGQVKAMSVGAIPKESLRKWLDKNI